MGDNFLTCGDEEFLGGVLREGGEPEEVGSIRGPLGLVHQPGKEGAPGTDGVVADVPLLRVGATGRISNQAGGHVVVGGPVQLAS